MKKEDWPRIFGEDTRPATHVQDLSILRSYNTVLGSYGINTNETIVFPSEPKRMVVFVQKSGKFPNENMVHVLVYRNGERSYISLGALHYEGLCGHYTCEFSKLLGKMNNDYDRLMFLVGKTIHATGKESILFIHYERESFNPLQFTGRPEGIGNIKAPIIECR